MAMGRAAAVTLASAVVCTGPLVLMRMPLLLRRPTLAGPPSMTWVMGSSPAAGANSVTPLRLLPLQDGELVAQDQDSAVFHVSSRRDSRSHAASRVIRGNTNRRRMIGDHHRQSAGRATLLVRAVDAILGTHRTASPRPEPIRAPLTRTQLAISIGWTVPCGQL